MARTTRRQAASTARARKRRPGSKRRKVGPRVSDLILNAVAESHEPKGVSLVALKKALVGRGYDVKKNNSRVNLALRSLVKRGLLVQTKRAGARRLLKVSKRAAVRRPARRRARRRRATKRAPRRVKRRRRRRVKRRSAKRVTMRRRRKVRATRRKAAKRKRSKVGRRRRRRRVARK